MGYLKHKLIDQMIEECGCERNEMEQAKRERRYRIVYLSHDEWNSAPTAEDARALLGTLTPLLPSDAVCVHYYFSSERYCHAYVMCHPKFPQSPLGYEIGVLGRDRPLTDDNGVEYEYWAAPLNEPVTVLYRDRFSHGACEGIGHAEPITAWSDGERWIRVCDGTRIPHGCVLAWRPLDVAVPV